MRKSLSSLRAVDGTELPLEYPDIGFFDIDRRVFADQYAVLSPSELGSETLSRQWFERNPSIYTVLMSGDNVVGYCNTMPLRESGFDALMAGTLADGEITVEMIERFDHPGSYRLFCCGVAILEEYRFGGVALRLLLSALYAKFQRLAEQGCCISDIAAVAWTEQGSSLCQGLGLTFVRAHGAHGDVYHTSLLSASEVGRGSVLRRLARTYQDQKRER